MGKGKLNNKDKERPFGCWLLVVVVGCCWLLLGLAFTFTHFSFTPRSAPTSSRLSCADVRAACCVLRDACCVLRAAVCCLLWCDVWCV
jgi:hypothetical protein